MADNIDNIENGGAENTTPETTVETVEVNDFFATPEVFVEDYFPVDMLNAQDPDKFPYNAEDLVGLPDTTTQKGQAAAQENASEGGNQGGNEGGNQGGETTPTTYTITVNQPAEGGTIAASAESAAKDTEITLTATPAENFTFTAWVVKDASDNDVTVSENKFTMPESNVTVTATFTSTL